METFVNALHEHIALMQLLEKMIPSIHQAALAIVKSIQHKGKVFWMGNGGSAADAQHLAAELIGRFKIERRSIPSIALTTDSSILTCLSNDYDFSIVFSRQLEALCSPNDIVIGLSTSGNSGNVLKGIQAAKLIGAYTIGFSGYNGGKLSELADLCLTVPSQNTARIQEAHTFIGHCICEYVESASIETENYSQKMVEAM